MRAARYASNPPVERFSVRLHPAIFGRGGGTEAFYVTDLGNGVVRVSQHEDGEYGPTMPSESLKHFVNDLGGVVDLPPSGDRRIDAVTSGRAVRRDIDEGEQQWSKVEEALERAQAGGRSAAFLVKQRRRAHDSSARPTAGCAADLRRRHARASLRGVELEERLSDIDTDEEWLMATVNVEGTMKRAKNAYQPGIETRSLHRWWRRVIDSLMLAGHLTEAEGAAVRKLAIVADRTLRDGRHDDRHYAATFYTLGVATGVRIHSDALALPGQQVVALLLHELGHVLDTSARHHGRKDGPKDTEKRADWLVERLLDVKIRYDERLVQTLGEGQPRPEGLR